MVHGNTLRLLPSALAVGLVLGLGGCPGSSGGNAVGKLSIALTDTPVDGAQQVVVAFTGVEVHGPYGTLSLPLDPAEVTAVAQEREQRIDLLKLQGDANQSLLAGATVPAGHYQWIRLDLDLGNSYIVTTDGNQYPLEVSGGSQSGLKLVSGFTVAPGKQADFVLDFDLRKSLTETRNTATGPVAYLLTPALRLVNRAQAGSIAGNAAGDLKLGREVLSDPACSPAVYLYSGTGITPEGFYVTVPRGTAPLTSATLKLNTVTGNYDYIAGFLAPGSYTLALACAANDAAGSTSLAFSKLAMATVVSHQTATADFP